MKVLVIGAGYSGFPLACQWKEKGADVDGWVLTDASAQHLAQMGLGVISGDVAEEGMWKHISQDYDLVYYCASTSGGGIEAYEKIHGKALQRAIYHFRSRSRLIYTSSTSVYGQNDGSWVTEESVTEPKAKTSQILTEAEKMVLAEQGTVVRIGGIYGPERGYLFRKFMSGEAVLENGGLRWVNQVHVEDVVRGLVFLGQVSHGEGEVYNLTDGNPVTYYDLYTWLSKTFQKPMPRGCDEKIRDKKRGTTNKRVSNRKLLNTGYPIICPTYSHGYYSLPLSL